MRDQSKTKDQLVGELTALRQRVAELEGSGGEGTRHRADELETLYNITAMLARPGTFEEKVSHVLNELVRPTQADQISLMAPDDAGLRLAGVVGRGPIQPPPSPLPLETSLSGIAFRRGQPSIINHLTADPHVHSFDIANNIRSAVVLPIRVGGRTLGVINALSLEANHFTPERVQLVTAIRDELGRLIESARLVEQEELRRREEAGRNAALAEIGRIISSSLEMEEVYGPFAEHVGKLIPYDRLAISIVDSGEGTRTYAHVSGLDVAGERPGISRPLAGSFGDSVIREGLGQILQGDEGELARRFPSLIPSLGSGLVSVLGVPLIAKGEAIGLLYLASTSPNAYSRRHLDLANNIGSQIAGAIANSLLYSQRKQAEEALAWQAAELARSNAELEQFAYVASHDLQEPLRKIQTFGGRLESTSGDALSDQGRDYVSRMRDAAGRMQALIDGLLTLSRVTSRAQPFVPVELSPAVREVLSDLAVRIEGDGAVVEVGGLPTIDADPTQMRQLFLNLIGNAIKFRRDGVPPVVKVHSELLQGPAGNASEGRESDGVCPIVVDDNGIGFDQSQAGRIFALFQRLHSRGEYQGTGIGLAICQKIVQRHGGTIIAIGVPGQGARFIVRLPVEQPEGGAVDEQSL